MKSIFITSLFTIILITSHLAAQPNTRNERKITTYGQKGIIELYGSLSLSGNSTDTSIISFSAEPGFNYFITDNFYMGPRLHVGVTRNKYKKQYMQSLYVFHDYYKTTVNLGLGIPLGFIFKVSDHVYFNLEAPELSFHLMDLKHFKLYPNLITAFKFPFDNAVFDIGVKHNFFHITDRKVSNLYYSYNVFFGLSTCFDTVKERTPLATDRVLDTNKNGVPLTEMVSPAMRRGKIAGAFFMSWLPVCSGSWLAGWDWGGFAFSFLKTSGAGLFIASICINTDTSLWVALSGFTTWFLMTIADMIYSPCMVARHY